MNLVWQACCSLCGAEWWEYDLPDSTIITSTACDCVRDIDDTIKMRRRDDFEHDILLTEEQPA